MSLSCVCGLRLADMVTDGELVGMIEWFFNAVFEGDVDGVRLVLSTGFDVNAVDGHGNTVLFAAAYAGQLGVMELLLEKGADVHAKDEVGSTPLIWAVQEGRLNAVKRLVEEGADVNTKCNRGETPLHRAAWLGKKEVAYFLLEHGARVDTADVERLTPLRLALTPKIGEPDVNLICRMLLPSGALVQLAMDAVEAHGERLKGIVKGLKRAVDSPGFLKDLADTLAGIDASGCARGTDEMLSSLLRQLDAFAQGAGDVEDEQEGVRARNLRRLTRGRGGAYTARRGRHRLAVVSAVQIPDFLSELAEGLAGANLFKSAPVAPKLVAAAVRLDVLSAQGAQQPGGARAPKRRRRGVA